MPRTLGVGRVKGLSKSIISHDFRGRHRCSKVLMASKQHQRMTQANSSRQAAIQEMSTEDQEIVENMMADFGMEVETFVHMAPPGEEGFDLSHAGGEHEAFEGLTHQLADLTGQYVFTTMCDSSNVNTYCSHHIDPRSRGEWTEDQTAHWNLQMDRLVDAYLNYRS
ncbi:hypothetical protein CY34DRAFT_95515 [Suillus luteus UH-Slu-Lm8-n1]|uniref:Uncharacterized protein n=1 Tax=Suillus luteus UH-Slu-Lm8-n1 TaxID=930992 RepID=A0A0D0AV49_9AGAM|nr:hypothetical protein CY34DRAFT_95515 [Suillus luteus UH-Slu-Lm8-n1]